MSETRIVLDTNVFVPAIAKSLNPALSGYEDKRKAYDTFLAKSHYLIISGDIIDEYSKVINEKPFNFSSLFIYDIKYRELSMLGKIRNADRKLKERIEVKVKIHEDDLPFLKAGIALGAKFIVTQDSDFLEKANEILKKHKIKVLHPKTYVAEDN